MITLAKSSVIFIPPPATLSNFGIVFWIWGGQVQTSYVNGAFGGEIGVECRV